MDVLYLIGAALMFIGLALYCMIHWDDQRDIIMIHHWKCKLTEETVEEIYIELREGTYSGDIANMFGISRGLVDHVNHGRSWPVTGVRYPIRKRNKPVKVLSHDEFPNEDYYPCKEWEKRNG